MIRFRRTTKLSLLLVCVSCGLGSCGDDDGNPPDARAQDAASGMDASTLPDAADPRDAGTPWVRLLAPEDGAVVFNPVGFQVTAGGVAQVEILADGASLGAPWDPAASDTQTYSFGELGTAHAIELRGLDGGGQVLATDAISITVVSDDTGTYLGTMWNTYYYLALETDYPGTADTTLFDDSCAPIADVPADFSDSVCIEGSGRLADGRVVNYASTCSCGRPCPYGSHPIICYSVLDPQAFPWGAGAQSNPLEPLRSWAVDPSTIPLGTLIYAVEWDGVVLPSADGLGGFTHDGCFRADDVGGGIQGDHYDFFAGTATLWQSLEGIFPTGSTFNVYLDPGRCAYLAP